jgi:membrane protease YdiL (CAAX protease family)
MQEIIMKLFFNVSGRMRWGWRLIFFVISLFLLSILLSPLTYLWGEASFKLQEGRPLDIQVNPWVFVLALVLVSIASVQYLDKRPVGSLGLKFHGAWWKEFLIGIGLGVFLLLAFLTLALALQSSSIRKGSTNREFWSLFLALIGHARGAIGEELLFRGFPLQVLMEGIGIVPALFVSSALFGLAHVQEQGWLGVVWAGSAGILLAVSYLKTKALWMPIGIHFSFNYFVDLLESFIGVRLTMSVPMVFAALFLNGAVSIFILLFRKLEPHPHMEELWQQHIHPAQPWAQLKAWWERRKNKTGNAS